MDWKLTKEELSLVHKVASRANSLFETYRKMDCEMDIIATHRNGCPLDLERLLSFDDFNFAHDIAGIHNCIDRNTGGLKNCFLPRCARKESEHVS